MRWLAATLLIAAMPAAAETPDEVARRHGLAGELLVAKGDKVLLDKGYGTVSPMGGARHRAGARWRLASITKQVTAVGIMRQAERGALSLDTPVTALGAVTPRMLLTHHTGLANPDDTPKTADGIPAFYAAAGPDRAYCRSRPPRAGAAFAYNNCDYILLGDLLKPGATGPDDAFVPGRFAAGGDRSATVLGFVGKKPEPAFNLASYDAAGGLIATARDVFTFDRALMTGRLLKPAALADLWRPEGNGSYQALGQWVFPGSLKGCTAPKRIVQRDGEIGGIQTRNFIFPDDDLIVIVFTNRSSDDFPLGEVWEGKGFTYDLLSAVACS